MPKTIVITDTATGMGRATVRREADLKAHAGLCCVKTLLLDVDDEAAAVPFTWLAREQFGGVDALVNNFGYYQMGPVEGTSNAAVVQLRGGLELTGFAGWLAWVFVHVWYLAGFRDRLMALASWAWYYLRLDRPIRIILQTPPDPVVSTLRTRDPGKKHPVPAEIQDGGRTL